MNLEPPEKARKLQKALHAKAKESPSYRFYALYDKVYREDVLAYAYECCKANQGVAGVDGQRFEDIEASGRERWLGELADDLRHKTYQPEAVKRVEIPKANGKKRPLGIPTIRDRVAQMALVLVLTPIFEADLQEEQYAYRPGRSALDAVRQVHKWVKAGYTEVVDADLSGYFDSIPHAELMKSLARRISDGRVLHLIKMWLEAPVEQTDERGRKRRTAENRDHGRGTPQGAPISPLLANIYMRRFILGWKVLGLQRQLKSQIVNYADDFVICCRGTAQSAGTAMRAMMAKLKLTVNEDKTRIRRLPQERFDFLGYTVGRRYSPTDGRPHLVVAPSKKAVQSLCAKLTEMTQRRHGLLETGALVEAMNRKIRGWANYFSLGIVHHAYRTVIRHSEDRLRRWLRKKHKVQGPARKRYSERYMHDVLGLVIPQVPKRVFPCAKA